jgi:outer membrane protein OmpA-like peptidoglycan-associated protein
MSEQNDNTQSVALWVVFGVVGLVVASAVTFAAVRDSDSTSPRRSSSSMAINDAPRVYFEVADDLLPAAASQPLGQVADAARADTTKSVHIVAFHDATGNVAKNVELARRRAERVHHALEANGVSPQQLVVSDPVAGPESADPKELRRVELQLR